MANASSANNCNTKSYENPYAYIENDASFASPTVYHYESLKRARITESRLLLQNQLAYADENGGCSEAEMIQTKVNSYLDASSKTLPISNKSKKNSYTEFEIEEIVQKIHQKIWRLRDEIWLDSVPKNPVDMLDPVIGLRMYGYDFDVPETLGQYRKNGSLIEVAGIIDNNLKSVSISGQFSFNTRNFTAAHELGHAVLHEANGVHRDKPLDGASFAKEAIEYQADHFAKYYLMPQKLLRNIFKSLFLTDSFTLNESTAFALYAGSNVNIDERYKSLRDLSRMLASTNSYNGTRFPSLATQFKVSTEAMAIRIEELNLIS